MKWVKRPRRVANKIIFLVLALELASMTLWGSLTYTASKSELLKSIGNQLNEAAYRTTSEIGQFFQPIYIEAGLLATNLQLQRNNPRSQKIFLDRLLNTRPEVEEVSVVDQSGMQFMRVSRMEGTVEQNLTDLGDDPIVKKALAGRRGISGIEFSPYLEPRLRIAFPIKAVDADLRTRAIVTLINLKWLWDIVEVQQVGSSGHVYVMDRTLKLVAYPDPSLVLKGTHAADTSLPPALFDSHSDKLRVYINLSNEEVAGVSRFDAENNWWVVVENPVAEGLAPLDRLIHRFVLAFVMAGSLTVLIVFFFARVTMRPLEKLEHAIDRLAAGDRKVQVEVPQHTELATLVGAFNDMSASLDQQQQQLHYQAHHDTLTGLPNRHALNQTVDDWIKQGRHFDLLLLDLDRFKEVNDSLGHRWGDKLLRQLADRLKDFMHAGDTLARLGGDEFAVMIRAEPVQDPAAYAADLRACIQDPFELEGINIQIDASIGLSRFPQHAHDFSHLLRQADVAMYYAKHHSTGVQEYMAAIDANTPRRLKLMSGLRHAIYNNELRLHYQPKIELRNYQVKAVEALVRWEHPELGLLGPDQFIPIGELGDTIKILTRWVIDQAMSDGRHWREQGLPIDVAVNISAFNIQDQDFAEEVIELGKSNGFPLQHLQVEITESAFMRDPRKARTTMEALDQAGVSIAIDDFGTGYSSLSYLKTLPVDELKIDKSFVMDIYNDDSDAVIVRSTIDLAHNLGLLVTAEGVENQDIQEIVEILSCDFIQGYHIAGPLPLDQLLLWLTRWRDGHGLPCLPARQDALIE